MILRFIAVALLLTAVGVTGCAAQPQPVTPAEQFALRKSALNAYKTGDAATAIPLLREWSEAAPDLPEPWFRLGNLHARQGRNLEAVSAYRAVLARAPGHGKALHNLAIVHLRLSREAWLQLHQLAGDDPLLQAHAESRYRALTALLRPPAMTASEEPASPDEVPDAEAGELVEFDSADPNRYDLR